MKSRDEILIEPDAQFMIIKRIDEQQDQVLDDLDSLNLRIENIIELCNQNRQSEASSELSREPEDIVAA